MIRTMSVIALLLGLWAPIANTQTPAPRPAHTSATAGDLVTLNTASASQLQTLPGIGKVTADRILEYRQKNGGFKKIEELMNVNGVGEKSFLKLKARITVTPAKSEPAAP